MRSRTAGSSKWASTLYLSKSNSAWQGQRLSLPSLIIIFKTFSIMKNTWIKLLLIAPLLYLATACQDDLDVQNPNAPTLDVLDSEEGILRSMLGLYSTFDGGYVWIAQAHHEAMGDALYIPWGNFGWRWSNQPTKIILDDGTVVTPPEGGSQGEQLVLFNSRAQGDNNAFSFEWEYMYRVNNIANLIISKLDEGSIELSGNAVEKEAAMRAYAHFWKGMAYSRIGSIYSAGLITDVFGETNASYVTFREVLTEADRQLDLSISEVGKVSEGVLTSILERAIPTHMRPNGVPSPEALARTCNTLKARNILVNTKVADMTTAQWTEILNLSENGLMPTDNILEFRTADENAFFVTGFNPFRVMVGWHFISERLIQDFKEGDARFERNFTLLASPEVNAAGRGIQYGTRYGFTPIESGGDYGTTVSGLASLDVAGTWEEAYLMRAEALMMTGQTDAGLALIDEVRTAQDANLDPVSGTGLSMADAYEELRRERRIGLFMRGLPFYDARRWGVTDPLEQGGGRQGAVILDGSGNLNTDATIDYNYLDYWGVPANELDFNSPENNVNTGPI